MKKTLKRIAIFVSTTILLVIVLAYSLKYFYRILPSDYGRHAVIQDILTKKSNRNNIIFFGDSRTMFGVDTKIIKEILNFPGEVYNLSSVGQDLYESSYYYGMIKNNTEVVVQCTSPSFFSKNREHYLPEDKAISMYLSGYRMNDNSKELIKKYNNFFDRNALTNYIESRGYFKSFFHSFIRPFFDNEKFNDLRKDPYFPHNFTSNKHPNYPFYNYNCEGFISKEEPKSQILFLSEVRDFFNQKGIEYILVFMPVNPDECKECYQVFKNYKNLIEKETQIKVIDLSDFISDTNYFYDAVHANKAGAKLISEEIANQMLYLKY